MEDNWLLDFFVAPFHQTTVWFGWIGVVQANANDENRTEYLTD